MPQVNPNRFETMEVILSVFRDDTGASTNIPQEYDITKLVLEVNIHEDLRNPFLTCTIAILDSAALFAEINFNGTEVVDINYGVGDVKISKQFYIYEISDINQEKTNDGVMSYNLHGMDEMGFINNFIRLRHTVRGNNSAIVKNLVETHLNSTVDIEKSEQTSTYLIPNLSPLKAAQMILSKTTSAHGEPMFFYSSIKDGPLIRSLGTLYTEDLITPIDRPFIYGPAMRNNPDSQARRILYIESNHENILEFVRNGSITTRYLAIDPLTGTVEESTFSALERLDEIKSLGRNLNENPLIDPSMRVDNRDVFRKRNSGSFFFEPVIETRIHTSRMFGLNSQALEEKETIEEHMKIVERDSDMTLLEKQSLEIICPGYNFMAGEENTSIGRLMYIQVAKNQPVHSSASTEVLMDKKRSGAFLITRATHSFKVNDGQAGASGYVVALGLERTSGIDPMNRISNAAPEPNR